MGLVKADIELKNPRRPDLLPLRVSALVDTGAILLCIPAHVALQLDLQSESVREVMTADGKRHQVPYVGPIDLRFENRQCFAGAMVLGNQVLLGAVPMEDLDVIVHPRDRKLVVNPDSPNIQAAIAMGILQSKE